MANKPAKKAKANPSLQGLPDWALHPEKYQYKKGANLKPTDKYVPTPTIELMNNNPAGYFMGRKKSLIGSTLKTKWKLPWQ